MRATCATRMRRRPTVGGMWCVCTPSVPSSRRRFPAQGREGEGGRRADTHTRGRVPAHRRRVYATGTPATRWAVASTPTARGATTTRWPLAFRPGLAGRLPHLARRSAATPRRSGSRTRTTVALGAQLSFERKALLGENIRRLDAEGLAGVIRIIGDYEGRGRRGANRREHRDRPQHRGGAHPARAERLRVRLGHRDARPSRGHRLRRRRGGRRRRRPDVRRGGRGRPGRQRRGEPPPCSWGWME